MEKPTECRWCGCSDTMSDCEALKHFQCGSGYWSGNDHWHRGTNCADNRDARLTDLRDRIQRAVDTLKKAERYTVTPGPRNTVDWDRNPDGSVTDSAEADEAIAILEGERDDETWHAYTEPPSDTRTVMLRFDPAGNHDCQGFYSYDFGSYARSEKNARQLRFVHPTRWRELTEEERDEP